MIPTLRTNKKILDDYKRYQEAIDQITDQSLKIELTRLLERLKIQVVHIDRNHEQLLISGRIPTEITDIRSNIMSIKKSLDSKIDMWNKSKFIVKPELRPNEEPPSTAQQSQ
jgi:hypothetical protein